MKPHLKKYKGVWVCYGDGARACDVSPRMAYFMWFTRGLIAQGAVFAAKHHKWGLA
jgi:hypothetical protein